MAQLIEYLKIAILNIRSNKGRSILTMLGIIIGISSVIMIISIGNGVKSQINGDLNSIAGGQIYVYVDDKKNEYGIEFTREDFELIKEKVSNVKGVTPNYSVSATVTGRKGNFDCYVRAGTPSLEYNNANKIVKGRYFNDSEYYSAKNVCVVTEYTAKKLFGTTDVVGMEVEISSYGTSQSMTIVGLRADSASSSIVKALEGEYLNLEIPISTLGSSFGWYVESFSSVLIITEGAEYASQVAKDTISLLEGKYNIRGKGVLGLENFNDYMDQFNSVLDSVALFVAFVAAISLLVGGIGVMNIMLVSVTERTREIGIRKALGARTSSIMVQFLSESAIITLLGGIIGILLGIGGASLICSLFGYRAKTSIGIIIGATLFSSAVGIFFGIYPAKKAAKLSPIEALRHE